MKKPLLLQAPVKALDPDGHLVLSIGTGLFAVAAIVCWFFYPDLVVKGDAWRLWVAICGTIFGAVALTALTLRKRARQRRQD